MLNQTPVALCIIGDEILSGRTIDANTSYIANRLNQHGCTLSEERIVPDIYDKIIKAVNELREQNEWLLTTGGIGPTHDDITADAIARAVGRPWEVHPGADELLRAYYQKLQLPYNEARRRMATMPRGAILIDNPISTAPAFAIENIIVMAGVPKIMQAMLENALPLINGGAIKHSLSITTNLGEGTMAARLTEIQYEFNMVTIGSYPQFPAQNGVKGYKVTLVVSGLDKDTLAMAMQKIETMIQDLNGEIL